MQYGELTYTLPVADLEQRRTQASDGFPTY